MLQYLGSLVSFILIFRFACSHFRNMLTGTSSRGLKVSSFIFFSACATILLEDLCSQLCFVTVGGVFFSHFTPICLLCAFLLEASKDVRGPHRKTRDVRLTGSGFMRLQTCPQIARIRNDDFRLRCKNIIICRIPKRTRSSPPESATILDDLENVLGLSILLLSLVVFGSLLTETVRFWDLASPARLLGLGTFYSLKKNGQHFKLPVCFLITWLIITLILSLDSIPLSVLIALASSVSLRVCNLLPFPIQSTMKEDLLKERCDNILMWTPTDLLKRDTVVVVDSMLQIMKNAGSISEGFENAFCDPAVPTADIAKSFPQEKTACLNFDIPTLVKTLDENNQIQFKKNAKPKATTKVPTIPMNTPKKDKKGNTPKKTVGPGASSLQAATQKVPTPSKGANANAPKIPLPTTASQPTAPVPTSQAPSAPVKNPPPPAQPSQVAKPSAGTAANVPTTAAPAPPVIDMQVLADLIDKKVKESANETNKNFVSLADLIDKKVKEGAKESNKNLVSLLASQLNPLQDVLKKVQETAEEAKTLAEQNVGNGPAGQFNVLVNGVEGDEEEEGEQSLEFAKRILEGEEVPEETEECPHQFLKMFNMMDSLLDRRMKTMMPKSSSGNSDLEDSKTKAESELQKVGTLSAMESFTKKYPMVHWEEVLERRDSVFGTSSFRLAGRKLAFGNRQEARRMFESLAFLADVSTDPEKSAQEKIDKIQATLGVLIKWMDLSTKTRGDHTLAWSITQVLGWLDPAMEHYPNQNYHADLASGFIRPLDKTALLKVLTDKESLDRKLGGGNQKSEAKTTNPQNSQSDTASNQNQGKGGKKGKKAQAKKGAEQKDTQAEVKN